ncbi:MAG TPA: hypothetical protein VGI70_00370 [Polyangiales bacterium]|jgi:hypothetical protein
MSQLETIRSALLALHKALLEVVRREHERTHGRLPPQQFLDALIRDPALSWLRPLTTLLVAIDEADDLASIVTELQQLLGASSTPDEFQQRYAAALQASPELAYEHGALMRALR